MRVFLIVLLALIGLLAVFPAGGVAALAHGSALDAAAPAAPDATMAPAVPRPAAVPLATAVPSPELLGPVCLTARDRTAPHSAARRTLCADGVALPLLR